MNFNAPLAEQLRPNSFDHYIGQKHLVGDNGALLPFLKSGRLPSLIFWGPPGVGKTSLSKLIAKELDYNFIELSAVHSGVKDVREAIEKAEHQGLFNTKPTLLFIDEIHRFSKSQQDSLLAAVEKGSITLVGATTENPSFEVISPLLSRCQVYTLKSLELEELKELIELAEKSKNLSSKNIKISEHEKLIQFSGGDARRLLNLIDICSQHVGNSNKIDNELVASVIKSNPLRFDKGGEEHYNIASALIKSIRGSDPNAAVYYLARLVESGEDPKFIARRLIISASEDIGLANPNALLMAVNAAKAVEFVGWPEGRIILSQCVIYLASSDKSNSAYEAIGKAQHYVRETGNLPIPLHLKNAPTQLMKQMGYGQDYKYAHDYPGNFVDQEYLPNKASGKNFMKFANNAAEQRSKQKLQQLWKEKYEW